MCSSVNPDQRVIVVVLDDVEVVFNCRNCFASFVFTSYTAQRHVKPVGRRDEHVGVCRNLFCFTICVECTLKIAFEVMSEAQVIPDVRLQRAGGNVAGIRQAVRFDLVGPALDQSRRFFKIGDRVIETSQSDETMAAMSIQSSVSRESLDAVCENTNRIFVTSEVRGASSEPDDPISGVSIFLVEFACLV